MNRDDLEGLLQRIEAATGPDREIDHAITEMAWGRCDFGSGRYAYPMAVTSSLDAIVGLIERELSDQAGVVSFGPHLWQRADFIGAKGVELHGTARSSALALCAALIKAKLAMLEASDAG